MTRSAAVLGVVLGLLHPVPSWSEDHGVNGRMASDETSTPACAGHYSLFRPEPDACVAPVDTDRPHLTDTPHTVPAGHFQLETGLVAFGAQGSADVPRSIELIDLVVKTGLAPGIDFQIGYRVLSLDGNASGWEAHTGTRFLARAKLNLCGRNGPLSLTLAPMLWIPTKISASWQGGATLLFGAELPAELDLEANLGILTEPTVDRERRWVIVPSFALTRLLYGPLSAFAETNHQIRTGAPSSWIAAAGLLLHWGPNMQLDAGAQLGLTGPEHPVTVFLGCALRI